MVVRTLRSGTRTAAGATDTFTFEDVTGKLLKVNIVNSASTTYKVYTLQADGSTVNEYILGAAGSTVTVATASSFYPGIDQVTVDGSTAVKSASPFVVGWNDVKVDASNLTAADTWAVELTIEL